MAEQGPLSSQVLGGKYLVGALLGEGGFGMVYAGQHLLLDRPQAIKLLLERYFSRPKFRERFLREARMVAALDHPHIVHIDDFGMEEQASQAYLVMPFLGGGTFHDVLKQRHRPLEVEQVVSYLEQIGSVLDYAHQRGVVHLDLKPQNLLVHEDGRLLLSDFGLAHLLKQEAVEGGTSLRYGTPHYMAPEHIQGQPEKQSDVYSFGVILYQMLVGRRPFEGSTPEAVMVKQVTEPPPPLQAWRPELPLELEEVVERALAKQVAQRYQSAGELVMAFKDALVRAREQARKAAEEQARKAREEGRARKAEEERARKAREQEEEQARKAEEERIRKVEEWVEERIRKSEEEQARKAREEQPPSRFPHPASIGILQGLRQRQLPWRKAGLLLILALLILGSAGGLFATMRISTARTQAAATANAQASATEQLLNPTTVGGLMEKWVYQTGGYIYSSPAVVNGVVYVGSKDGNLYALDAASGAKKWAYQTGKGVSSPVVVNGVVYVGSEDGNLYALDATSGAKKWAYQTGGYVISSPAVINGVVYVGSWDHNLYAFHLPGT
jgi:eukaryotic-like serine/threonine-protein kinase